MFRDSYNTLNQQQCLLSLYRLFQEEEEEEAKDKKKTIRL